VASEIRGCHFPQPLHGTDYSAVSALCKAADSDHFTQSQIQFNQPHCVFRASLLSPTTQSLVRSVEIRAEAVVRANVKRDHSLQSLFVVTIRHMMPKNHTGT
jgi:hypothetical protein